MKFLKKKEKAIFAKISITFNKGSIKKVNLIIDISSFKQPYKAKK